MRSVFAGAIGACGVAMAFGIGPASAQDTLTVSSWGGAFQKAQRQAWFDVTEKELKIKFKEDTTSGIADVRTQVASGKPTWDLTTQGMYTCLLLEKEGKLEPLSDEVLKAAEGVPGILKSKSCVSQIVYSVALGWREKAFPGKVPTGWKSFWDVKNFPGQRSMRKHPIYALEMALIADGADKNNLYPLDVERAFKKLAEIKPHVLVWWGSGAQSAQVLKDGEVDMVAAWNGRIQPLADEPAGRDGKISVTFDDQILVSDCWMVPKGAPNKDLAMKAIAFMMKPEINARISNYINYAPGNSKAYDTGVIEKSRLAGLPNTPENIKKGFVQDPKWWVENADVMVKRFDAFLQQ